MLRKLLLIAFSLVSTTVLHAQTATACPSTKTLDDLIKALDEAVSGPGDKDRTCMRQLFVPDGRLVLIAKAKDGSIAARILTVEDWINRVKARGSEPFYEHQVKYSTDVYGNMEHVRNSTDSRWQGRGARDQQYPGCLQWY